MSNEHFIQQMAAAIRNELDVGVEWKEEELRQFIEDKVFLHGTSHKLTVAELQKCAKAVYSSLRGFDVLQPLLDDPEVTEIMVNAHDEIFIERNGCVDLYAGKFESRRRLEDMIQMIVAQVNRIVNETSPIVDARLPDGSRVNIVLPPIALKGPAMTIRKFPSEPMTMSDLVKRHAISQEAADVLNRLVKAKYNIFISGSTGSGKTTFLNALCQWIPPEERVITIEDSAELQIRQVPNVVSMETRNANSEGKGAISIRHLIKTSLRMRPNRIIVGEVRGEEAVDMLQAMNTGHDGSLSTGHANSSADMVHRLVTMVLSGTQIPAEVARKQIASAIDIMVHLVRLRDHSRRVYAIEEIVGVEGDRVQLNPLFLFQEDGEVEGKVVGALQATGNPLHAVHKLAMAGMILPIG